ncbi:MAG: sulfatase-like hydrolase/transferase [Oscillospiraceae bacterium]|nr:sulfatase-like hydrolase/transferase [Oscillospiraceae bacterium]
MAKYKGKYKSRPKTPVKKQTIRKKQPIHLPFLLIFLSFFFIELFAFPFLSLNGPFSPAQLWPLAFGLLWAVILSCLIRLLPNKAARIIFGIVYFLSAVYAGVQTGYYILFSQMMWLSDFRYASEGADYADVLLTYPIGWWLGIFAMIALGVLLVVKFPVWERSWKRRILPGLLAVSAALGAFFLPEAVFISDSSIRYAGSDYGRAQSAEAAYDNMFNTHRLYQVCGLYQTLCKDVYAHAIYPLTPSHALARKQAEQEIDAYFASRPEPAENAMTGLLKGKNVILVLMESMDDWMIGQHTPTLNRLMAEGINFTRFYTPVYGGIRTFNTEFSINTGSFLSSQGGYAFDYVTNTYTQSLASQLREEGYSAKTFHYNDPSFYSRGEFSPAMGYEEYVCYADYIEETDEKVVKDLLYDDLLLFDNVRLNAEFFRQGQPSFNFIITRSAHLSYKYNEVLSYWGLKKYPGYKGLTGNEETDCAYLKARLVDDMFARLMEELDAHGQLENTVIIGVTDHYTYGYKNMEALYALSGTTEDLLLERTPCFIWAAGLEPIEMDKVLNTSDLLPTVLNLLGIDREHSYIGHDAFDDRYDGFVPFSNGSWIYGDTAYDAGKKSILSISGDPQTVSAQQQSQMAQRVQEFIRINNLILDTDYYK